jgi:large subunit ribosomal protein L12e
VEVVKNFAMGTFGIQKLPPKLSPQTKRIPTPIPSFIPPEIAPVVYEFTAPPIAANTEREQIVRQLQKKNVDLRADVARALKECETIDRQYLELETKQKLERERKAKELERLEEKLAAERQRQEKERIQKEQDAQAKLAKEQAVKEESARIIATKEPMNVSQQLVSNGSNPKVIVQNTPYPDFIISPQAAQEAAEFMTIMESIKASQKQFQQTDKNSLMKIKMQINKTVGQLTPTKSKLIVLLKGLEQFLTTLKQQQSPLYEIALYILAKKVAKQAETECSVHPNAVYPLALLVVYITKKHDPFWKLFWAKLIWKCCYLRGGYPFPLLENEAKSEAGIEAYRKRSKWRTSESESQYLERMAGMVRLFAALLQTDDIENPIPLSLGWKWMSRLLNLHYQHPSIHRLYFVFLETCGWKMKKHYEHQVPTNSLVLQTHCDDQGAICSIGIILTRNQMGENLFLFIAIHSSQCDSNAFFSCDTSGFETRRVTSPTLKKTTKFSHTKNKSAMPPKPADTEVKYVIIRSTGGEVPGGSVLAPKLGPLGVPPKKAGDDIAKATQAYKGLKVTVRLAIQNRQATVEVLPSASTLVIQALKEPPRDKKKEKNIKHNGNLTLNQVYEVARKLKHKSYAKEFSGNVKEILGTCFSVGCTVDGQAPMDLIAQINDGSLEVPSA